MSETTRALTLYIPAPNSGGSEELFCADSCPLLEKNGNRESCHCDWEERSKTHPNLCHPYWGCVWGPKRSDTVHPSPPPSKPEEKCECYPCDSLIRVAINGVCQRCGKRVEG